MRKVYTFSQVVCTDTTSIRIPELRHEEEASYFSGSVRGLLRRVVQKDNKSERTKPLADLLQGSPLTAPNPDPRTLKAEPPQPLSFTLKDREGALGPKTTLTPEP